MKNFPESWSIKRLGEVATLQRGFDLPIHKRISNDIPVQYCSVNNQTAEEATAKVSD